MAYNPVPTVVTGDLWTASNHNTYIRDNFAAGVPGIIQAKGDLAVGSTVRAAGRLPVGANNLMLMADSSQSLGIKWGKSPELLPESLQNSSWTGTVKSVGNYVLTANGFNNAIPASARGLIMTVSAKWNNVSGGNFLNIAPGGATYFNCLAVRAHTNEFQDNSGVVPLNAKKQFEVKILGASCEIYVDVWGWFL